MGLQVYPYIYARTFRCDFCPPALFAPEEKITSEDDLHSIGVKYAGYMNNADINRKIVRVKPFRVGNNIIELYVFESKSLTTYLENNNEQLCNKYKPYSRDEGGRRTVCGVGIVVPIGNIKDGKIPELTIEECVQIYLNYVPKVWDEENTKCTRCSFIEITDSYDKSIDVSNLLSGDDGLIIPNDQNLLNKIDPILKNYGCSYKKTNNGIMLDLKKMTDNQSLDVFLPSWLRKIKTAGIPAHININYIINGDFTIEEIQRLFENTNYEKMKSIITAVSNKPDSDNPLNKVKRGV